MYSYSSNKNCHFLSTLPTYSGLPKYLRSILPVPQQYPLCSMLLQKGGGGVGLLRLLTNKTVSQAALTLHPYRLSFLTHFMSGSCQPLRLQQREDACFTHCCITDTTVYQTPLSFNCMYTSKGHSLDFNLSHLIIWQVLKKFLTWGQVELSKVEVKLHTTVCVYTPSWGQRLAVASADGLNQLSGLS